MSDQQIKIKCKTCGAVLTLRDAPNVNAGIFTCPKCGQKHKVGDCERYRPVPQTPFSASDDTNYPGQRPASSFGDATQTGAPSGRLASSEDTAIMQKPLSAGKLVDMAGNTYPLSIGQNTIGRKAQTSNATIQILTNDRTMSRNHAVIYVENINGCMQHTLKNWENKNPTCHNNTPLVADDQDILNEGDQITLGKTIVTFKL